ncbi:aminoacyl-tRNA hydrolase [Alkalilimnicola sp. S0819]|uniref:aminoacyl-tRNA hydrolase n=1 Tax=Alkalilimnicola sp. S0819 TaxID=2613922 RepID=UPI001261733F|nr:aminoacyl-tRNA hydrolase [Alkalilimnicola sp. S0819]KAB7623788.1 aminoacyl-tRNA hydrolase [Alkalilimnicola sp. S0819]MPQ16662.1 aminoacyl-tRNA hydrolase [Alkalilimnicola sp. S0819]
MAEQAPKVELVVGLGNPGERYAQTRHNAGFWFVDELARRYGGSFRAEGKFFGELARVTLDGVDCHLLKPMTFMNKSGQSIQALAHFYKIPPERILVVHDELDLPPGQAKLKQGGGHGGHNGLRDTIRVLGRDFGRLRLGVGHPGHKDAVVGYVLSRAPAAEEQAIRDAADQAADCMAWLLAGDWGRAQQRLHT